MVLVAFTKTWQVEGAASVFCDEFSPNSPAPVQHQGFSGVPVRGRGSSGVPVRGRAASGAGEIDKYYVHNVLPWLILACSPPQLSS